MYESPSDCVRTGWQLTGFDSVMGLTVGDDMVYVVDDVYCDPDAVRSYALNACRSVAGRGRYPGRFLFGAVPTEFYCDFVSEIVRVRLNAAPGYRFAPFGAIDLESEANVRDEARPHTDTFCDYVAIVYLSERTELSDGRTAGTSFWSKSTPPPDSLAVQRESRGRRSRVSAFAFGGELELVVHVGQVMNRMVILPAHVFHRIELGGVASGDGLRLTQNIYLVDHDVSD